MNLTTTTQLAKNNGIKVLVYGQAGAGKTCLCATTPDHARTIILSAEAGLLSIAGADIAVIEIKSIQDLMDAYGWLTQTEQGRSYEWICLDSISEMGEVILNAAKKHVKDPPPSLRRNARKSRRFGASLQGFAKKCLFYCQTRILPR